MKDLISIAEFSVLTGIAQRTLQTWDNLGYLPCAARGSRQERLYRRDQAEEARALFGKIKKPLERAPRYSKTPYQKSA